MTLSIRPISALMACCIGSSAIAGAPPDPPAFEAFLSGLSSPIGLTHAGDGSGRLFVNQQGGQLRVVRNGNLLGPSFISFNSNTACTYPGDANPTTVGFTSGGERGLLGVAFHPQYASNGRLFVSITDANGDTMLLRYTASNPAADTLSAQDLATCTVLLRGDQDFGNHNGGHIAFGADGYLYFGLGDGGDANDTCNRAQTLAPADLQTGGSCTVDSNFTANGGDPDSRALMGKMLRLNVDASTPVASGQLCGRPRVGQAAEYAIPPGQPSVGGVMDAACDEVWAYGLRNPWQFSFDSQTGDLWIGDVGQGSREEIDFEPAGVGGRNYGWRCREGTNTTGLGCAAQPVVPFTPPALDYARSGGNCSVTGGYRYRGPVLAAVGNYFYGDYCTGNVWVANEPTPGNFAHPASPRQSTGFGLTGFGEGEDGELYLVDSEGVLLRLEGLRVGPDDIFANGFETP